ncbi:hypothetical protein ACFWDG_07945 [Peribacillus sp. NPDC060186]
MFSSSFVCSAVTIVRTLALPKATVGKEIPWTPWTPHPSVTMACIEAIDVTSSYGTALG